MYYGYLIFKLKEYDSWWKLSLALSAKLELIETQDAISVGASAYGMFYVQCKIRTECNQTNVTGLKLFSSIFTEKKQPPAHASTIEQQTLLCSR